MDSDLPFGYTHRQKRSHAQAELEDSASPTWSTFNFSPLEPSASASRPQHSSSHPRHANDMPGNLPRRFAGDGFDYRRPVNSASVIDLTDDDAGPSTAPSNTQRADARPARPPRFGRDIMQDVIDVDAMDAESPASVAAPPEPPEVEFVSSRRLDTPSFGHFIPDEDDLEIVSENPVPESQRRRNTDIGFIHALLDAPEYQDQMPHLRAAMLREHRASIERQRNATMNRMIAHLRRAPIPARRVNRRNNGSFLRPNLNFNVVGFELDLALAFTPEDDEAPAPAPQSYTAPENAPEGFTRSPQEQDVLVCPNCQQELCSGESEQKRQVWVVKQCGHVYCGECTVNRFSSKKSAKGKEKLQSPRTKTFKECVVEDCQKRVSNRNAMIQIFL